MTYEQAMALLKKNGQEQVLRFWKKLSAKERKALLAQFESIDFKEVIKQMRPTANYLGKYNPKTQRVNDVLLTPEASTFMVDLMGEPFFIGCRQLCDAAYQARPLYAIYNNTLKPRLRLTLTRQFHEDRERLYLEEVTDEQGNMMKRDSVTVMLQSIADDGNYWLDKGEFTLGIGESLKD